MRRLSLRDLADQAHQFVRAAHGARSREHAVGLRGREIERRGDRRLQHRARVERRLEIAPLEQRAIAEARPVGDAPPTARPSVR